MPILPLPYASTVEKHLQRRSDYDAAFVIVPDQFSNLPDGENPYLFAKAILLTNGIPVQEAKLSTITRPDASLAYVFQNISVALYAKMGGVPWTVNQDQTVNDEVVVGMGLVETSGSRFQSKQRVVGITTVFRGDGNYLLANVATECPFDEYRTQLRETMVDVLKEVKHRNGWRPGDTVRVVFHASKPLRDLEVDELMSECVTEAAPEQSVQFAFIDVLQNHPFHVFNPAVLGKSSSNELPRKGAMAPERGTAFQLGQSTWLLSTNGVAQIKRSTSPLPTPLLIHLHRKSTGCDLPYLTDQVLKFTSLTWRSTLPAAAPVTIYYSSLIADLLTRLKAVPGWSPNVLNTKLRSSKRKGKVVPVRDIVAQSFAGQLGALEKLFLPSLKTASPESAFIQYVFSMLPGDCRPASWPNPIAPQRVSGGMAPELASVGFLSALTPPTGIALHSDWRESFARLRDKDPFPVDRLTFTLRPIEFLGICIGARTIAHASAGALTWLRGLLPEQRRLLNGRWSLWMSSAANVALSGTDDWRDSVTPEELPVDELALLTWLCLSPSVADQGFWKALEPSLLQRELLLRCATAELDGPEPARAALLYGALKASVMDSLRSLLDERWQATRSQKDALELVTVICRRFHRMAQQLRTRRESRVTLEIADEYDVQDLMHAVLLLFFDDVREETWTPNYGGNSSRTDFVLWKESMVIEAKMARKNHKQKDIANELIIDKERYRADSRCKTLVCFVYDPAGFCANPLALENDLSQDDSPQTRVIVFSGRG